MVHAHGSAGGNEVRGERDQAEQQGDGRKGQPIEPLEVHFRGRFRLMLQQTGSGGRSLSSVHANDMGSWALGMTS